MKRILKIYEKDRKNTIFISDLHINHDREFLYKPRGFNSAQEHYDWIKSQWKEHVNEDTVVINLGDSHFKDPKGVLFRGFSNWPCKEHYILEGNHTSGHKQCYQEALFDYLDFFSEGALQARTSKDGKCPNLPEVYPLKFNNITFCGNDLAIHAGKKEIHCSHFPKRIWDHIGHGAIHVSGHSHGSDKDRSVKANSIGKTFDVGIENAIKHGNKFCFTLQEVLDICAKKDTVLVDHHDSNTNRS